MKRLIVSVVLITALFATIGTAFATKTGSSGGFPSEISVLVTSPIDGNNVIVGVLLKDNTSYYPIREEWTDRVHGENRHILDLRDFTPTEGRTYTVYVQAIDCTSLRWASSSFPVGDVPESVTPAVRSSTSVSCAGR
jgi:hypothetical protein